MRIRHISLLGCLMVVLTACSSFQPKSDVDQVRALAQARVDALLDKDLEAAYELMSPGYRASNTQERFDQSFGLGAARTVSAKVDTVTCEAEVCRVSVVAQYLFPTAVAKKAAEGQAPASYERVNEEKWIKVEGKWWFMAVQ